MRNVSLYHGHRFPAEIIGHSVWLYCRFTLSFRDVEEMLAHARRRPYLRSRPRMVVPTESIIRRLNSLTASSLLSGRIVMAQGYRGKSW